MKKRVLCTMLVCVMLLPMALCAMTSCGHEAMPPEGTYTRMTVDINPGIEFMIDDQNKVASVTALNDDGSILIAGEAFVGKTPEEAVELVVTLAGETGYLVSGNAEVEDNQVSISISGDSDYAKQLMDKVEKGTEKLLAKLDIEGKVARAEALHTDALKVLAMETALFTEEEVDGMTEDQLYAAIAAGRVETALLLTGEMREAYRYAKESHISFARSEATAAVIEAMGGAYRLVHIGYKAAVDAYSAALTALEEFRYECLVSPESDYQKSLAALREAKTELLEQKNFTARLEIDGEEYASASLHLQMTEEEYEAALAAYEALGTKLNESLAALIEKLRASEALLRSLEDTFSDSIKEELQAKAEQMEESVNAAKERFFAEFEAAHKDDIDAMEQSLIEQKNKLKAAAIGTEE